MFLKSIKLASALVLGFGTVSASAATHVYNLSDHPFAGKSNYEYGLRVDEYDRFFSFENGGSATLVYDDDIGKVRIEGQMRESLGGGAFGALWDVKYTITGVKDLTNGFFKDLSGSGVGNISLGATVLKLGAKGNNANPPAYFKFAADGHRIPGDNSTPVGRGWVNFEDPECCNDFLFIGEKDPGGSGGVVPLPAAGWMLISGLAGLGVISRRRRRS